MSTRASRGDAHFVLDDRTVSQVARLVARLDGMPLAMELAAARAEALGVSGLLARLDDRFALLAGGDRLAPPRQQSLAAAVEWSYQLLDEPERRAFRAVSVFPGPFTLEGAEAVAGTGAGLAALRLVDCSLLVPPRPGADGRPRYVMLETLRAYGAKLRDQAGEQDTVAAALAGYALQVAEEASAGLQTGAGEVAAALRLDAEDPAMRQVLAWAVDHDPAVALRLAVALGWWWQPGRPAAASTGCCPRWPGGPSREATGGALRNSGSAMPHDDVGRSAQGAGPLHRRPRRHAGPGPSRLLADVLASRSMALLNTGQLAEGTEDGRRALAMARDLGDPAAEVLALAVLGIAALYSGDYDGAIELIRRQQQIPAGVPADSRAGSGVLIAALIESGDLAAAESTCAAALARCRDAGDMTKLAGLLSEMAELDVPDRPFPGCRRAPARRAPGRDADRRLL